MSRKAARMLRLEQEGGRVAQAAAAIYDLEFNARVESPDDERPGAVLS
jgi:hypothetical protein